MNKTEILSMLKHNKSDDGTSQFNFSHDTHAKETELKLLKELEHEGYIQKLTASLSYAIYQIL